LRWSTHPTKIIAVRTVWDPERALETAVGMQPGGVAGFLAHLKLGTTWLRWSGMVC
jgi:hypothetical protein